MRVHDAESNLWVAQAGRVDEANREDHVGVLGVGDQLIAAPLLHALVELVVSSLRATTVGGGEGAYIAQLKGNKRLLALENRHGDGSKRRVHGRALGLRMKARGAKRDTCQHTGNNERSRDTMHETS